MILLQTRPCQNSPWRNVHAFDSVNPAQIETVKRSRLIARLWDPAQTRILAQSLPARSIPIRGLKPADVELAIATFG